MAQHTPGPWMILPENGIGRIGQFCILTENGHRLDIASTYGWPQTPIEANARLIAAAPDMLAALIETLPQAEGCFANHYGDNPEGGAEPKHITMIRAAIAKATGQQS